MMEHFKRANIQRSSSILEEMSQIPLGFHLKNTYLLRKARRVCGSTPHTQSLWNSRESHRVPAAASALPQAAQPPHLSPAGPHLPRRALPAYSSSSSRLVTFRLPSMV